MKRMYAFSFVFFIIFNFSVHAKRYHGVQKYYFQSIDIQDGKGFAAENAEIDAPDMFWNQNIAPANGKKIVYGEVQKYKNHRDEVLRLCLIQSEEFLIIYNERNKEPIFIGVDSFKNDGKFLPVRPICASSTLAENGKRFDLSNITNINSDSPWCEGKSGNGIGESITVETSSGNLIFFNGFFSTCKRHLFEDNSRLKKIRICIQDLDATYEYILKDTWLPQRVTIPCLQERKTYKIDIKILEVYEGKKYKDTCLSGLFFDLQD